jgi:hypothetical protein
MSNAIRHGTPPPHRKLNHSVFKYAIKSSSSVGSSPYWKPGMSGPPFKINPRSVFICSGIASLNCPAMLGPITAGEPNFSFRGRWQREQRCKNKPSPRRSWFVSFAVPGADCTGLSWPRKCADIPSASAAAPTLKTAKVTLRMLKVDLPSSCPRLHDCPRAGWNFCTATECHCQGIRRRG